METHKVLMVAGLGLFAVMAILLRVGTTSLALFIGYAVLAAAGLGMVIVGQKMRDRR